MITVAWNSRHPESWICATNKMDHETKPTWCSTCHHFILVVALLLPNICDGTRIRCYTYFNRWGSVKMKKNSSNVCVRLLHDLLQSKKTKIFNHNKNSTPRAPSQPLRSKITKCCLWGNQSMSSPIWNFFEDFRSLWRAQEDPDLARARPLCLS